MKRQNPVFAVWVLGGFSLLVLLTPRLLNRLGAPNSVFVLLPILLIVWLVGSIAIGVTAYKKSERVGKWLYGLLGVALFLFIADSIFGVSRKIQNLNRKDEFANIYHGAPECRIQITLHSWDEAKAFNEAMKEFAVTHAIRECRNIIYMGYSGPPRCTFKGEHVAVWSSADSTGIGKYFANVRLAPFDVKYSPDDFKALSNSLDAELKVSFSNRVDMTFKEAERQTNGIDK